ncbi:MAG TPA: hypothetical protein VKN64_11485 [Halanaerobiales bacterium]|nr:hypothetical protein [Halanaerobiales bacterium]
MNKKLVVVILTVLLLLSLNVKASEKIVSKTVKVIAYIPVFQEMEVVKPIYIKNINDEVKDESLSEPVIIRQAGKIRVKSNSSWSLELTNVTLPENCEIKIKESESSVWKDVSRGVTNISGENGDHLLSFDLKLVPNGNDNLSSANKSINFNYTLVQI